MTQQSFPIYVYQIILLVNIPYIYLLVPGFGTNNYCFPPFTTYIVLFSPIFHLFTTVPTANISGLRYTILTYLIFIFLSKLFLYFLLLLYNDNYVYKLFVIFIYVIDTIFITIVYSQYLLLYAAPIQLLHTRYIVQSNPHSALDSIYNR